MPAQALFGLSVLLSFVASGIVVTLYIAPKLKAKRREEPLVIPHMFRFVGLSFLVPGVVSLHCRMRSRRLQPMAT
jgi:hypothetical protein